MNGPTGWLIVARNPATGETKYFVSNAHSDTPLDRLLRIAVPRWNFEHLFGVGKSELGFSHFEGAVIGKGARIGPFSRFRPGARIGADAHIGNFVEVKNTTLGPGAKANHLAYLGDGVIGAKANVGAGTIFCNYDGFSKHKTEIGEGAFIGSNSSLVAPVTIGAGAYVGSGSVITRDVTPGALALERSSQEERPGWAEKFRMLMLRRKATK